MEAGASWNVEVFSKQIPRGRRQMYMPKGLSPLSQTARGRRSLRSKEHQMRIGRLLGTSVVFAVGALGQSGQSPVFEVASVKAAPPSPANKGATLGGDPGRLDWTNVSLRQIIALAYELKEYQISGPEWLAATRFDLQAKLPDGAAPSERGPMLQA